LKTAKYNWSIVEMRKGGNESKDTIRKRVKFFCPFMTYPSLDIF